MRGAVRGELVEERLRRERLRADDAGLLVLTCGTYGNVLRFLPPLVIAEGDLDRGLAILERALLVA